MAPFLKETQDISLGETEHATDARSLTCPDETKHSNPDQTPEKVGDSLEPTIGKKRLFSDADQYRTPLEEVLPISLESIHALLWLRSKDSRESCKAKEPRKPRSCAKKRAKVTKPELESRTKKVTIQAPSIKTATNPTPQPSIPIPPQVQTPSLPAPQQFVMAPPPTLYAPPN